MRTITLAPLTVCIIVAATALPLTGQALEWPWILALPQQTVASDSNGAICAMEQSLYIRRLKSQDSVMIKKNTPSYGVSQGVDYELTKDYWSGALNQFFDLSGEAVRKTLPFGITAGLEWSPVGIYNKYTSSRGVLGSLEAGPVVRLRPFGIPFMMHSGGAARAWNDSLSHGLGDSRYDEFARDRGLYAGAEIGTMDAPLPTLPLFVNIKGYGRSMENSKLVAGTGAILLYHALQNGDSLFGLYTDSLINGSAALGQNSGKPRFINDPVKTERAYQLSAGFKGATRLFLDPSVVVSHNNHSLLYPDRQNLLPNRTSTDYSALALLSTVPDFPIGYRGGFRIDRGDEKNSATIKIPQNAGSAAGYKFDVNLDSYKSYKVSLNQYISKYFFNGMGGEYSFDISRSSREYPNFYIQGNDTVRSNNDNDIIVNKQRLALVPVPVSWGNMSLYYEFSKNLSNYVRKEKSGQNTIDWFYRVGVTYKNTVFGRCTLSEAMSSDAKVTRYAFPQMNKGNPPPYSRKWTSLSMATLSLAKRISLLTELNETYSDNGTLNSREYLDSTVLKNPELMASYKDYYAIVEKLWVHNIKMSFDIQVLDRLTIDAGCAYQVNDAKTYDILSNAYIPASYAGRRISPFLRLESGLTKHIAGKALLMYNFDSKENFWDILVSVSGDF